MSEVVDIHKRKGKRPEYDIYIGRAVLRSREFYMGSIWSNPYTEKRDGKNFLLYYEIDTRKDIEEDPELYNLRELVGRKLGCWCITTKEIYPTVCHGQIIMKLIKENISLKEQLEIIKRRSEKNER